MSEDDNRTTTKKIIDAVIISSLSSLVASVIGAVAFMVYNQAQTATDDIKDIKTQLDTMQQELQKANDTIISELAPLKAEHESVNKRFEEIDKYLHNQTGEFLLPERPTYDDIKEEEEDLKGQFQPFSQQAPPQ
jgi:tetrahydromethanopterin S-methyltransferase subunit G